MKETIEDTKGVFRSRNAKKGRKWNRQTKKEKRTKKNDLQKITYKTKERTTWTPLKILDVKWLFENAVKISVMWNEQIYTTKN
jgi:hypothetical protein